MKPADGADSIDGTGRILYDSPFFVGKQSCKFLAIKNLRTTIRSVRIERQGDATLNLEEARIGEIRRCESAAPEEARRLWW